MTTYLISPQLEVTEQGLYQFYKDGPPVGTYRFSTISKKRWWVRRVLTEGHYNQWVEIVPEAVPPAMQALALLLL